MYKLAVIAGVHSGSLLGKISAGINANTRGNSIEESAMVWY